MADITYLPTGEGWLYLAVILERATRRVVGWALRPHLGQELARSALEMALTQQRPASGGVHQRCLNSLRCGTIGDVGIRR